MEMNVLKTTHAITNVTMILWLSSIICHAGVTIGLEMVDYTVPEEGGTVEVCAVVTGGALSESVTVTLQTTQDSAIG